MKILVAHNLYRGDQPSGENQAVADDAILLREAGHDVKLFLPSSDDLADASSFKLAIGVVRNSAALHELSVQLRDSRPDVLHVHNIFPRISPAFIAAASRAGIPIVQTIHNYRARCMAGVHSLHGQNCFNCEAGRPWAGVRNGCYRGSRQQSVVMAAGLLAHQRQVRHGITRFLCLTEFAARWLADMGVERERISVRATWAPDPGLASPVGRNVLFVGRLDPLKGVDRLIEAWGSVSELNRQGRELVIVGSGPLEARVAEASESDASIRFEGRLTQVEVAQRYKAAAIVAVPSQWLEGFPRVIAEAFSHGRPVLAANNPNLASIVPQAVGWTSGNSPQEIADTLNEALSNQAHKGEAAREAYLEKMTPSVSLQVLEDCYHQAIVAVQGG